MVRTANMQILLEVSQYISNKFKEVFSIKHLIQAMIYDQLCNAHNLIMENSDTIELLSHNTIIRLKDVIFNRPEKLCKELKELENKICDIENSIFLTPLTILKYSLSDKEGLKYLQDIGVNTDKLFLIFSKPNKKNSESILTPTLDKHSIDLTQEAKKGMLDPVVGRKNELGSLINALCRRIKCNALLIGEAGVGKTSLVEGLAQSINDEKIPEMLRNKRVISLDIASLVAGTKFRGDFEERMQFIINEIISAKNIILFIDEIHTIIGAGDSSHGNDVANILKPYLSKGKIQVIGATTTKESREIIEKDDALERRFQRIVIDEPTEEETINILNGIRRKYEEHHKISIPKDIIKDIVTLSGKYIHGGFFPDKAIDILDQSAGDKKIMSISNNSSIKKIEDKITSIDSDIIKYMNNDNLIEAADSMNKRNELSYELDIMRTRLVSESKGLQLTQSDINKTISRITRIPINELSRDNITKLKKLEEFIRYNVISQEDAIKTVVKAIKRNQVGLRKTGQPIGSFLFLGPTGVGKTWIAKKLAEGLFGSEKHLKKFDMSEYADSFTVSKLLGAPAGYVGYEAGGELVNTIKDNPYCVLLFDEVEKAHPDIFDIFLQMMDDGKITDKLNRTVNLENTIIIMTSNIGSYDISKNQFGFIKPNSEEKNKNISLTIKSKLKEFFRPEFINRIGNLVVFNSLSNNDLSIIFDRQVKDIQTIVKDQYDKNLIIDESTKNEILNLLAQEKETNARPMRRLIRDKIEDITTDYIIEQEGKLKSDIIIKYDKDFIINEV